MSDPTPAGAAPRDEARIPYRGEADEDLLELARKHLYLTEHDHGYKVRGWDAFKASLAAAPRADPDETILKIREIAFDYLHGNGDGWRVVKQIHELADAAARAPGSEPS